MCFSGPCTSLLKQICPTTTTWFTRIKANILDEAKMGMLFVAYLTLANRLCTCVTQLNDLEVK